MQTIVRIQCEALRCEVRNNYLSDTYNPPPWLGAAGVSSRILPKGAPPVCERGGTPAPAGAEAALCMYVGLCVF